MPDVAPPDAERESGRTAVQRARPPFTSHLIMQPRIGARAVPGLATRRWRSARWLGLAEPRPIDALSLAFFSDALFSPPFIRLTRSRRPAPTIDLTIHFRTPMPRDVRARPRRAVLRALSLGLIHEGFFEEDGVIWAADGTVLAQSRQLGDLLPLPIG